MKSYTYTEGQGGAGLLVYPADSPTGGFFVCLSGEDWDGARENVEKMRQGYANAIADDVHGAELTELRAQNEALHAMVMHHADYDGLSSEEIAVFDAVSARLNKPTFREAWRRLGVKVP